MTVMERFEAPTDRARLVTRAAGVGPPAERRNVAVAPAPTSTVETSETDWDGDAIVVPSSGYGGLLALGAVAGTTAAAVFGAVVGWTGPVVSFAALVGLDVGVLVGAAVGGLVARREPRTSDEPRTPQHRRPAHHHRVAVDPSR